MRISDWLVAGMLSIVPATGMAQVKDYKDPYTASEAGKPMAPAKAVDVMLSQFETEVMRAAEAMPAEKYSFEPTPATFATGSPAKYGTVRTFAEELTHIAGGNYYFYSLVFSEEPPNEAKQVRDLKTKEDILLALKQSFSYAHKQVARLTLGNAFVGIEGADGMHTPITLATFAVAHGYDHYGQIVEYLRMNGVVPPGSK